MRREFDSPIIRCVEQYGFDGGDGAETRCPVCGSAACDTVYVDRYGEVAGCDVCLTARDVYSVAACCKEAV